MKIILPFLLLIISTGSIGAQKHTFGVKAGIQLQGVSGVGIDSGDERLYFVERNSTQAQFGVYYRQKLEERVFLEAAPQIFRENIQATYSNRLSAISGLSQRIIQTTNLYFPVLIRLDLKHQLSFSAGVGSILFLQKKEVNEKILGGGLGDKEKQLFDNLLMGLNNWPVNLELGLSYGIGRFSLNGKYLFRASKVFDDINISGIIYPIDLKTDAFQIDLSYRIN